MKFSIRPIRLSDAEGIAALRCQPEVAQWTLSLPSTRVARMEEFIKGLDANSHTFVAVTTLPGGSEKVIGVADTFLVDVKAYDSELHRRLCGLPNERILSNLRLLDSLQRVEIRIPFVPGQNAGEIEKIADFLAPLTCVVGVRVLKYHNLSGTKYESLDMTYPLDAASTPVPTAAETEAARAALEARGIRVLR